MGHAVTSHPRHPRLGGAFHRATTWLRPVVLTALIWMLGAVGAWLWQYRDLPAQVKQLQASDSSQTEALNRFGFTLTAIKESLEAGQRLQCIEARDSAALGHRAPLNKLDSVKINCDALLGNRIRS